jgi:hypothetical protein
MQQIKDANRAAGYHWFDSSTTGFFGSRYGRTVYGGRYFIESSPFAFNGPRVYSIREAMPYGGIETVCVKNPDRPYLSENVYETRAQAVAAIKRLMKERTE